MHLGACVGKEWVWASGPEFEQIEVQSLGTLFSVLVALAMLWVLEVSGTRWPALARAHTSLAGAQDLRCLFSIQPKRP